MSYVNPIRKLLNENEYLLGSHVCMREPAVAELLASMYDFVWIDWEHTWMDRSHIMNHLQATRAGGAAALVRVPWNDPVIAKPILEMGPDGIIFPQIHNLAEAKAAIAACTYPPEGIRGWGPCRAVSYGRLPADQYLAECGERLFIILQIENLEMIDDLEEIAKLPGVGAFCVGPMDLSASVGKLAQTRDPEVLAAYDRVGEVVSKTNIPLMISWGFSEQEINEWKARGTRIFSIESDYYMITAHATMELNALNPLLGRKPKGLKF